MPERIVPVNNFSMAFIARIRIRADGWPSTGLTDRDRPAPRSWRLGRDFGRRLTRIPAPPRPQVPLYTLGTAARIERIRLLYERSEKKK
jgi:hypothetical protein